ncbi:unnamed protein product [Cunninghamella blakesleeana]
MTSLTKGVVGQNSSGDQTIFEERFKYFLAKNKRNKHFMIQPTGSTSLPSDSWTFVRRDSNGSTDSGFQSATTTASSKEDYFFWNYNDDLQLNDNNNNNNNDNNNNNNIDHLNNNNNNYDDDSINNNNNMFMMMERPANPLSSILSGRRSLQSNTSISSTLSTSPDQLHQNQFYQHDEDDQDDGDDENDEDDQLPSNEYYLTTSSVGSDLNSPSIITTTVSKPSLLNYPSFKSNHSTLSNSSNNNNNNNTASSSTPSLNDGSSTLFKSESNGFFTGNIEFNHDKVLQWAKEQDCCDSRILKLEAIENKGDQYSFPISQGIVNLIEPTGISIISDIDDTIKETQILHGARTVLQNTFFNPTNDIPGMAEAYMKWYTQGASFHYVSNSPFQLLPFLQNFLNESQFPPGSMHLRLDGSLLARLIEIPGRAKRDAILSIMNDFPKRQFVLVGDSGEIDLEIYTKIALEHPDRILKIFIHDITTKYAHYKQQKKMMQQAAAATLSTSTSTTTNHSIASTTSSTNKNEGGLSLTSLFQTSSITTSTPTSTKRKSSLSISTFMNNMNISSNNNNNNNNNNKNDDQQVNDQQLSNSMDDLFSTITRSTTTGSSHSSSPLSSSSSSMKSSSLLEMASSISSTSFLGLGKNNNQSKKTLAGILTEPSLSFSSSSTTSSSSSLYNNNNNNNNDLPPSQQCAQLYDRVKKSQDQLPSHIQIVLFKDADELRDDPVIHDALWQHWDNQC